MNAFLGLSLLSIVWLLVYMTTQDIMKVLSKHLIYLTLICALFEAGAEYGGVLFYLLMSFVIVMWLIALLLDYMDAFIKPAKKMVEITTPKGKR
jgi:hypothetical protein